MLRRTKREVEKELPSKTEHIIKCAMSGWQKILYQQITDKASHACALVTVGIRVHASSGLLGRVQICLAAILPSKRPDQTLLKGICTQCPLPLTSLSFCILLPNQALCL